MTATLAAVVRRCVDPGAEAAFFGEVVGLPPMRAGVHWAGEDVALVLLVGRTPMARVADRRDSPANPIVRCLDLAQVRERVRGGGGEIFGERTLISGDLAYFLDPQGHVAGLQERKRTSPRAADAIAFDAIDREAHLRDPRGPMGPGVYGLGWVSRWVVDADRALAFYRDALGLPYSTGLNSGKGAMLSLGGSILFEVKDGGKLAPGLPPESTPTTIAFAVDDPAATAGRLVDAGGSIHQGTDVAGVDCAWVMDPEGLAIGLLRAGGPLPARHTG
jgi:predicted enzyme related to lactoylglutathione lyase